MLLQKLFVGGVKMNNEMLWNKFMLSGKVEDYLNYCTNKNREEKADESEYRWSDNQREKHRGTE